MNPSQQRILQALLVLLLVGACCYLGYRVWRNFQVRAQSERAIREALNQALKVRKVDPIKVVDLPNASRLFGVPESLDFEQHLFRTDDVAGRRPVGTVTGTFNRNTGEIRVDVDFFDGKREHGLREYLDPIP